MSEGESFMDPLMALVIIAIIILTPVSIAILFERLRDLVKDRRYAAAMLRNPPPIPNFQDEILVDPRPFPTIPGISFEGAKFKRPDGGWDVVRTDPDGVTRIYRVVS